MEAIISYLREVRLELSKVVWPKKDDVIKLTVIVLIISGIFGVYLGAVDFILTNLLTFVVTH